MRSGSAHSGRLRTSEVRRDPTPAQPAEHRQSSGQGFRYPYCTVQSRPGVTAAPVSLSVHTRTKGDEFIQRRRVLRVVAGVSHSHLSIGVESRKKKKNRDGPSNYRVRLRHPGCHARTTTFAPRLLNVEDKPSITARRRIERLPRSRARACRRLRIKFAVKKRLACDFGTRCHVVRSESPTFAPRHLYVKDKPSISARFDSPSITARRRIERLPRSRARACRRLRIKFAVKKRLACDFGTRCHVVRSESPTFAPRLLEIEDKPSVSARSRIERLHRSRARACHRSQVNFAANNEIPLPYADFE